MTVLVDTWVDGLPKTKGSLDAQVTYCPGARSGKGPHKFRMVENVDNELWRQQVGLRCREDYARRGFTTPYLDQVRVSCTFLLPNMTNDVDKMARLVLDSLATLRVADAHVFADDVQVRGLEVDKFVAPPGHPTGALIQVSTVAVKQLKFALDATLTYVERVRRALGHDSRPPAGL